MAKCLHCLELLTFLVAIVEIDSSLSSVGDNTTKDVDDLELQFQNFIVKFNKSYAFGSNEYFERLRIFESNLALHAKLNSVRDHPDSAIYGVTKFSDLTQEEFRAKYLSGLTVDQKTRSQYRIRAPAPNSLNRPQMDVPQKFDWRDKQIIAEPRSQQECGGCWAFASVETIESQFAKQSGNLVPLSVQQMLDCSFHYSDALQGCSGGDHCSALLWANKTHAVFVPESRYPFANRDQSCQIPLQPEPSRGPMVVHFTCNRFVGLENTMLDLLVSNGPLVVAVDANNWNNYQGGIIQYHCGEVPSNHVVQVVGYDLTGSIPYYIVKNSWGTDWGHGGYLYIMYGSNVCSLAEEVSTVEVASSEGL